MVTKDDNQVEALKVQAMQVMKDAGFSVSDDVEVEIDQALPFMGYTTERDGKSVIVVSGKALSSGMAINLLIHELSHVYRLQSKHPSHDYNLLTRMTAWVVYGTVLMPYQEQIVQTLINNLQDLYADDISFAIFAKHAPIVDLSEFFLSWIHKPESGRAPEATWTNAGYLLSAAFAQANLERHKVDDKDGKVAKAIQTFLSQLNEKMAARYDFFKDFMVNLPEEVTEKEFEKLLITYISEFLKLTKST